MANPPPSTPQRRSSRKSAVDAKESIRSIAGGPGSSGTSASPAATPKKKRPTTELLGKRISVSWPRDRTMYECRVVDYNAERKKHKVIYDTDSSIEEVNLARRKFKLLDSTPAEKAEGSYIGLKISLPPRQSVTSNSDAISGKDYIAMVTGILDPLNIPAVDPAVDDTTTTRTYHKVLYLSNEYVAEVNLDRTKFIVLDAITNEPIRTVNEGLELVELEEATEEEEDQQAPDVPSAANDKSDISAKPADKSKPASEEIIGSIPKTISVAPASEPGTQQNPVTKDSDAPPSKNATSNEGPTSTGKTVAASVAVAVLSPAKPAVPATKQLAVPSSSEAAPTATVKIDLTVPSAQADAVKVTAVDQNAAASKEESPGNMEAAPMVIDTEIVPAAGNTNADGSKPERTSESTGVSGSAAKPEKANPSNDVFNPEVNAAHKKPLTAANLSLLESAAPANGNGAMDEDTKTVSIGDDKWIEASANAVKNPKDLKCKFIALKYKDTERTAYVEDFLSNGTHFIAFQDKEGGNMQMLLTTENFRVLTDDEVENMSKNRKRNIPANVVNGKAEEALKSSKRRRSVVTTATSKPVAGGELVGKVIYVRWPGNGGNYLALVVGFQHTGNRRKHKVYYVEDESTEVIDLSKRDWVVESTGPWDSQGLVGKRLYVYWDGSYTENDADQKRAEAKFGVGKTKIPFEAFVVKFISSFRYRLLYTQDDNLEDRDLTQEDDAWDVLDAGKQRVDNLPLISWSGPISD